MTTPPANRPNYTLTDAAKLVGVSRSTIRRRRETGQFPNAYQTRDGQWMVPLTDLLAAKLTPANHDGLIEQDQPEQGGSSTAPVTLTGLAQAAHEAAQTELAHLREQLQNAEHRAEVERTRANGLEDTLAQAKRRADDLSKALLMLEVGNKPAIAAPPAETRLAAGEIFPGAAEAFPEAKEPAPAPEAVPAKKSWLSRLRGV